MSVCRTCRGYGCARGGHCWACNGSGSEPVEQDTSAVQAAAGEGEREAVALIADETILKAATEIRESSVAWANDPEEFAHLIELTPAEIRKLILSLLRPAAPDAGGVDHADIAARLHPDLFSSDERTAQRAASPYAVSIKRAEAVAEVGRVLAAAAALQPGGER